MVCMCVRVCVRVCVCVAGRSLSRRQKPPAPALPDPQPQPVDLTHITAACVFLVGDSMIQLPPLLLLAVTLLQLAQPDLEALW